MSEWSLTLLVPLRILIVGIFTFCYVIGGRDGKWMRRIVGPVALALSCILISIYTGSFTWWLVPAFLPLLISIRFGYGGDTVAEKVFRRSLYGFAMGVTALTVGLATNHFELGAFQFSLALLASLYLGTRNPVNAVGEEALIGGLSVFCIPFMI